MVAIPVDRVLQDTKNIVFKRMVPGNILIGEVKGGKCRVAESMHQMENYVNDYKRSAPAIPFESLVTDRMVQKDTTEWVTRIYYPVY